MELNGRTLDTWLREFPEDSIPERVRYIHTRYPDLVTSIANIHPQVEAGAQLADGGLLTGHGPRHINRVIERASQLVQSSRLDLSVYEVFLLMIAINLHDTGNMYGRSGHEQQIGQVIDDQGLNFAGDASEKNLVIQIASAHGGKPDSLDYPYPEETVHNDQKIRIRIIAALLKFADELSEDKTRAAQALMQANLLDADSLLYHNFAATLDSVLIKHDGRSVDLYFDLTVSQAFKKYPYKGKRITLLEYLYARTLKTHFERIYCMRFLRPYIELDAINVKIDIWNEQHDVLREPIKYKLEEKGYPEYTNDVIYKICPELKAFRPATVMARLRKKRPSQKSTRQKNGKRKKR